MLPDYSLHDGNPLDYPKGSYGRIGLVNLTTGEITYDEPDPTWMRRYLGGGALAGYYLLKMVPPEADAFDPENILVFASSVVAGLDVPGAAKHTVVGKSPLTGGVGEAQSVGTFGQALKRSGLDALVVYGKAEVPSYIVVEDGDARIEVAPELWGTEVADAHEWLIEKEGPTVHTSIIGEAGENLVRYASIVNDVRFMNCRTGLGAVMGSKNLKAVVVEPGEEPEYAYPEIVEQVRRDWEDNSAVTVHNKAQREMGISSWLSATEGGEAWPYVTGNYDKAVFDDLAGLSAPLLEEKYSQPIPEDYKWFDYARIYHVPEGPYKTDPRYGGSEGNSLAGLGPTTLIGDAEPALKLVELSYKYGLDPESLGTTLAWVMSGHAKGYLPEEFADGLEFGDADAAIEAVRKIALREDFGDLLAEGAARAAETFGEDAQYQAVTVKGKEVPVHEPRNKPGLALAYGVGVIGPDYCVIEHDWDYSPDAYPYILKKSHAYLVLEGTDESEHSIDKIPQVVHLQRWWSGALETLLFDLFSVAPARYMPPSHVETLVRGVTGWDVSLAEILAAGERRLTLFQEFNRRSGWEKEDDYLPDRMYEEPIPDGKYAGSVVDREWYAEALDLYYDMNGFDEDGWPKRAKLLELDLDWLWQTRPDSEDVAIEETVE